MNLSALVLVAVWLLANGTAYVPASTAHPVTSQSSDDPFPSQDGRFIVVASPAGKTEHLIIFNTDGTVARQLTSGPHVDQMPAWSHNGKSIVFVSDRDGNNEIYIINPDGSGL